MSQILDVINKNLIIVKDNNYSDNNMELNKYQFWRYEYPTDTKVKTNTFIKFIDSEVSWSNYRNKGLLNIYRKK